MRITTWNINSVRAHLNRMLEWHDAHQPDVLCLQETKCQDFQFPTETIEDLGYYAEIFGQKTYNGVALISTDPLDDVATGVPWPEDEEARGITGVLDGVRIVNVYVVNGQEVGSPKYAHKLAWLGKLADWLDANCSPDEPLVVCGDFNICPDDRDVYDPEAWRERILCSTPEREAFQRLLDWGLTDALRLLHDDAGHWTWWDMRTRGYERGEGLRIDHFLVSRPLVERVVAVEIDAEERGREHKSEKPSDHAPVTLVLEDR